MTKLQSWGVTSVGVWYVCLSGVPNLPTILEILFSK